MLLNASNGEILSIVSAPYFDPNQIETAWLDLIQDPAAPLLNRATLGQYTPGTSLGPFLLAYASSQGALPAIPSDLTYTNDKGIWKCAVEPQPPISPGKLIASGCPAASAALSEKIGARAMSQIFASLGFYTSPELPLEIAPSQPKPIQQAALAGIGQEDLVVTPLQMALAAAALSNRGMRPAARLVSAVLTPEQGWVDLPAQPAVETPLAAGLEEALDMLTIQGTQTWDATAVIQNGASSLTWYIAGTLPQKTGKPLALALILEENNPNLAKQIGQSLLKNAIEP